MKKIANFCESCVAKKVRPGRKNRWHIEEPQEVCKECRTYAPNLMAVLYKCASHGHLECTKAAVEAGADVNGGAEDDNTSVYPHWQR